MIINKRRKIGAILLVIGIVIFLILEIYEMIRPVEDLSYSIVNRIISFIFGTWLARLIVPGSFKDQIMEFTPILFFWVPYAGIVLAYLLWKAFKIIKKQMTRVTYYSFFILGLWILAGIIYSKTEFYSFDYFIYGITIEAVLTLLIDISGILMITGISLVLIQDRKLKRNEEAETENQFVKSNIVSPKSVTVIAWLSIILAIIGVIPTILLLKYVGIYLVLIFIIASLVQIILATGMLNGKNWGRVLFLLLTPLSILIDFTTGSASAGTIIKAGYYIIFAYYLTRKPVIEYFKQNINISENNNIEKNEYICSECGADIKEEDKICTKCGAKLDEIEEE